MPQYDLKTWVEIVQGIGTILGVAIAGLWSYYTFVRGRTFAPNLYIQVSLKQLKETEKGKIAVISICLENVGKTYTENKGCYVTAMPILIDSNSQEFRKLYSTSFPDPGPVYTIFEKHVAFEPNEKAIEEIAFFVGDISLLELQLEFFGKSPRSWVTNVFLNLHKDDSNACTSSC